MAQSHSHGPKSAGLLEMQRAMGRIGFEQPGAPPLVFRGEGVGLGIVYNVGRGTRTVNVVLISTYELGHQPFGLASPAAWLRGRGANVTCLDLSREGLREDVIRDADFIAFYVPMHTATRLAARLIGPVRQLNPRAHLCVYGLYASVNEAYLRGLGVQTILGGEFEEGLAQAVTQLHSRSSSGNASSAARQSQWRGGCPIS